MFKTIIGLLLFFPFVVFAQGIRTPLEEKKYSEPTNYAELSAFVNSLKNPLLQTEVIGKTVEGRNIYALKFSKDKFGKDKSKTKVMIFAQQHGNEQSGKEGALLLAAELLKPENSYLFDRIDLALIPQVNADGAEINKRRNAHNADPNRNHLIMEEPEVMALHRFFDNYLFDVTLDVHEYSPYDSEMWRKFGYRKNAEETIGVNTNCNIPVEMRDFANTIFIPYFLDFMTARQISNSIYAPGGPPDIDYFRQSTFDVNDGRQSFGIQNTFSVILEGLNGEDNYKDNIQKRAKNQKTGMLALLEFSYQNSDKIKTMVSENRKKLSVAPNGEIFAIQMEHVKTGSELKIPVYSYTTGNDSVVITKDYRSEVKSILDVDVPIGYLIPKNNDELVEWIERQNLTTKTIKSNGYKIEAYTIKELGPIDFEGDTISIPKVGRIDIENNIALKDYIFIPVNQLKKGLIISALEPQSELGLATYSAYEHLLKIGEQFPILRVVKKQ